MLEPSLERGETLLSLEVVVEPRLSALLLVSIMALSIALCLLETLPLLCKSEPPPPPPLGDIAGVTKVLLCLYVAMRTSRSFTRFNMSETIEIAAAPIFGALFWSGCE
jgi:hypothetical protein